MHSDAMPQENTSDADAPAAPDASSGAASAPGRTTLASLLGLSDEELAQPLPRIAPQEHGWEQLTLEAPTDPTSEPTSATYRSGAASQPPTTPPELIPGLGLPGAVEVPVYLAGKALHDWLAAAQRAPTTPPAIAVEGVGRHRNRLPAPKANFIKADHATVLLPTSRDEASRALSSVCPECGNRTPDGRCAVCRPDDTTGAGRVRQKRKRGGAAQRLITSNFKVVRTLATLMLVPGELTRAYLAGHQRRYLSPFAVCTAALALFAVVSMVGSLRPRPDRVLRIGIDRAASQPAGLTNSAPVNLAVQAAPDLLREVAVALNDIPVLWFPLMAFGIVAVAAALRAFEPHDDFAEVIFAAHFSTWFVLWWGAVVPALLLLARYGLESAATLEGAARLRPLADGRVEGLSPTWNALRAFSASPQVHSGLLALGLVPWAAAAWRRVFRSSRTRAAMAGVALALVPVLLLVPFA
jgi:hypothetical protein